MSNLQRFVLGPHVKLTSGFPFSSKYFSTEDGIPLIRIRDIVESKVETYYTGPFDSSFIIKNGDVLIGMDGDFNVVRWKNIDALLNQRILKVQSSDPSRVDTSYLFHWLKPFVEKVNAVTAATTVKHLSTKDITKAVVEFPDVHVQQRIARVLDTVDRAIEKTESLIAKYQQIKAGLMHDLFTRGVTADGKLRPPREQAPELYHETPIGWIPKEWQYELLDKLAVRGSGHTPNKNMPAYWNGGVKWISLADSYRLDRLYIDETEYEISQLGIQNSSAVLHPAGIVVLSRDAGVGKSAITTAPMAVSQHFMCWRCDARLDKHFLYYWLQFKKRMFENIAMGSTILTIGLPYFKKLRIAAPRNPEEQKYIGERLKSTDEKIFTLEADLEKKQKLKAGLMHDLLTGKVGTKG